MIDIKKTYRSGSRTSDIILQDDLGQNRLIGLYGPSGVGKTTVLKVLAGLVDADVCNSEIGQKKIQFYQAQKDIAIVYQDAFLPSNLTVEQTIELLTIDSVDKANAIRNLGIDQFYKDKIKRLSQGQRQRVAIVTCLFSGKNLLLLDEPFSAIGDDQIDIVCEILRQEIEQNQSRIALICSHRRDILDILCSKIINM